MITNTIYSVSNSELEYLQSICERDTHRLTLNEPTGDFFYDRWNVKDEYLGTPIVTLLDKLPFCGEARIIKQESGTCYFAHSDIDDRYHVNISGDCAALIDIDSNINYFLHPDGKVYLMDAGKTHSAANFGEHTRFQLVVRMLLRKNSLLDVEKVLITPGGTNPRFTFDKVMSPWLNWANKKSIINNFKQTQRGVTFEVERYYMDELKSIIPKEFGFRLNNLYAIES
jgi:hypothetical protein